jgi:hypothetical protein
VGQGGQKGTLRVAFAPLETQGSIGSPTGESGSHMKTLGEWMREARDSWSHGGLRWRSQPAYQAGSRPPVPRRF